MAYNDPLISGRLDMPTLARMAALPPDQRTMVIRALGPDGVREAILVYEHATRTPGLGKSIFSKIGDFLGDAAKVVGNVITGGAFTKQPESPPPPPPPPPPPLPPPQTPEWVIPAVVGGGALLLVILLTRR